MSQLIITLVGISEAVKRGERQQAELERDGHAKRAEGLSFFKYLYYLLSVRLLIA